LLAAIKNCSIYKNKDIMSFCLQYFTHLVVNDSEKIQDDSIKFIKDCLLELFSPAEKNEFINRIVELFLSTPLKYISQEAVIEATFKLGVSDTSLINYLVSQLGIEAAKVHEKSPVMMMFSVLSLVLKNYEKLKPVKVVD